MTSRCAISRNVRGGHQENERALRIGELCPIQRRTTLGRIFVSGENGERCRVLAMRHRDSGVRRDRESRADSGNDFKGYSGGAQRFGLFAAAPEDKRVAALQTNDLPSPRGPSRS